MGIEWDSNQDHVGLSRQHLRAIGGPLFAAVMGFLWLGVAPLIALFLLAAQAALAKPMLPAPTIPTLIRFTFLPSSFRIRSALSAYRDLPTERHKKIPSQRRVPCPG